MPGLVVVHPNFEAHWPFATDHFLALWQAQEETKLIRLARPDERPLGQVVPNPSRYTRLACLGVPVTLDCLQSFSRLREATFQGTYEAGRLDPAGEVYLRERGVKVYHHRSEGFWGQSVAEFALGLTICGLRRIPQNYYDIRHDHEAWQRYHADRNRGPGQPGAQFSDDPHFSNGTVAGKRVRLVGIGNIGSRYASFTNMLGAEVAAWDPFATEAHFHRSGARQIWRLPELVKDAQIFAPMLPLTPDTRGLVTAELIDALPTGCLVVLVTRAAICDVPAIRRRVLADELALAADVFDLEPLPLDDPLLGRHNVVHTPHLAGRTADANRQWVADLAVQFEPVT